jgi:hypothetical protein
MYMVFSYFIGLAMGWAIRGLCTVRQNVRCKSCGTRAEELFIYCPCCGTKNSLEMRL